MAFSYNPGALEVDLNWVRFKIGDTDSTDELLSDEEITSLISLAGSRELAAVKAARAISARYTRFGAAAEAGMFEELADTLQNEIVPSYLL